MVAQHQIVHLYLSPAHNFVGHHGQEPGNSPALEVIAARCIAGRGVEGDRYFGREPGHKGQITFFAMETYEALCRRLPGPHPPPQVLRRNVLTRGIDLNALIGVEFELQGVRFEGVEECRPCYWMDRAFGPGAEEALQGRGGLRARILTDGVLHATPAPPTT